MPITTPKVPDGLPELMRGLAKSVIKENPENIYVHAAEYFENLIRERDGDLDKGYKNFSAYKVYSDYKDKCREKGISVGAGETSAVVPQVAVSDGDDDDSGGSASAASRGKRRKRVRKQGSKDSNKSLEKDDSAEGSKAEENLASISENAPAQEESIEQPLVKVQAHKEFQMPKERSFGKAVSVDSEAAANAVSTVLEDTVLDSDDADRETGEVVDSPSETPAEAEWENLQQPINCEDLSSYPPEDFGSAPSTAEVVGEVVAEPETLVQDVPPVTDTINQVENEEQAEEVANNADETDLSVNVDESSSVEEEKEPLSNGLGDEVPPESTEKNSEEINQPDEGVDTVDTEIAGDIVVEPRMDIGDLPDVPVEEPGEAESTIIDQEATEIVPNEEQNSAENAQEESQQSPNEESIKNTLEEGQSEPVQETAEGENESEEQGVQEETAAGEQSAEHTEAAVEPINDQENTTEDTPKEDNETINNDENIQDQSQDSPKDESIDNAGNNAEPNEDANTSADATNEDAAESENKSNEQPGDVVVEESEKPDPEDVPVENNVPCEVENPQDPVTLPENNLPAGESQNVDNVEQNDETNPAEENSPPLSASGEKNEPTDDDTKPPSLESDPKPESEDVPNLDENTPLEDDTQPGSEAVPNPDEAVPSNGDPKPESEEVSDKDTEAQISDANIEEQQSMDQAEDVSKSEQGSPVKSASIEKPESIEQAEGASEGNGSPKESSLEKSESEQNAVSKQSSAKESEADASSETAAQEQEASAGVGELSISSRMGGEADEEQQADGDATEPSAPPLELEGGNDNGNNTNSGESNEEPLKSDNNGDTVEGGDENDNNAYSGESKEEPKADNDGDVAEGCDENDNNTNSGESKEEPLKADNGGDVADPVDENNAGVEPVADEENGEDSKNLQEASAISKQTSEEDEGSKEEVAEEPCIQRQVSPSTSKRPSKSHSVDLQDIKKVNLASFSKDSAEALFYSLKKTELENEEGPPNDPSKGGNEEGEEEDDDADVVLTEEAPAPTSRQQTKRSFTDDFLEKGPITEEAQQQAEGGGVAKDDLNGKGDGEMFNPMKAAAARNQQLQEQMHARDDTCLEDTSQRKTQLRRSMTERVDLVRQDTNYVDLRKYDPDYVEEEDQFDGYYIGSVKNKILSSSISVADSDYFDPEQAEAIVDDNNVQTALETIASTDTESTLPSQTTIQANRGFLKKSSQNASSNIPYASFGNNAIDQSLDEFIEREEKNKEAEEQAAASTIQRSYRQFRSNKKKLLRDYHSTMQTCTEDQSTESMEDYPNSIIQIKVDPKRTEESDDNSLEDARTENRRRPMYSLNIDEYDTAARRMTLTRGVAMQRTSTPEEDSGKSDNASGGDKKAPSEPVTTVATTEESPISSSERSDDKKSGSTSGDEKENKDNSSSKSSEASVAAEEVKQKPRPLSDGRKNTSLDAQKLFIARQRTMPVQIDASVIRVLPKHMRKRNKSAGMIRK